MRTPDHEAEVPQVHRRTGERRDPEAPAGSELASQLGNTAIHRIVRAPGVQRAGATGAQQLDESIARAIEGRRGQGRPLQEPVRRDMEEALGHDLSGVRVHTDRSAHELNDAVGARAFTAGDDVFFKQGTYDPSSSDGKQLLGHELTHVVQQRSGTSGLQPGQVSHPDDPAERHAESVGQQLAQAPATAVSRQAEEEEELQMSPDSSTVHRQAEEEEELQMSPDPTAVHRQAEEEEELAT
jgi:hypothetical protein